jgi:hypothetical protein
VILLDELLDPKYAKSMLGEKAELLITNRGKRMCSPESIEFY